MIAEFAPALRPRSLRTLATLMSRLARARRFVADPAPEARSPEAAVAGRLAERLERVSDGLAEVFPQMAPGDQPAGRSGLDPAGSPELDAMDARLASISDRLAAVERALVKLPGQIPPPPEAFEVLQAIVGDASLAPLVLVGEDLEFDADGFIPLPVWLALAPLEWPRRAIAALALAGAHPVGPGSGRPEDIRQLDRLAASLLGPAYGFALAERWLARPAGSVESQAATGGAVSAQEPLALDERIATVAVELERSGLLAGEFRRTVQDLGAGQIPGGSPPSATPGSEPPGLTAGVRFAGAYRRADAEAAEFAAQRLSAGVLASARPSEDLGTLRAGRERLLALEDCKPEDVYQVLDGLREVPLSAAQILNGGWLALERNRAAWLSEALASVDPARAFGRRVLALDALVLRSLETAGVHRLMEART